MRSCVAKAVKKASERAKSWARMLSRIFEVEPLRCPGCRGEMKAIAVIKDDSELKRLLTHIGLPADFPRITPARGPPLPLEDSQIEAQDGEWDGIDEPRFQKGAYLPPMGAHAPIPGFEPDLPADPAGDS